MMRGEVRWYQFAAPDKRRPVVVLTRDSIIPSLGRVTSPRSLLASGTYLAKSLYRGTMGFPETVRSTATTCKRYLVDGWVPRSRGYPLRE